MLTRQLDVNPFSSKMSQGKRNFREQLTAIHIFLLRTRVGKDLKGKKSLSV